MLIENEFINKVNHGDGEFSVGYQNKILYMYYLHDKLNRYAHRMDNWKRAAIYFCS